MKPPARTRKPSMKKRESDMASAELAASSRAARHSSRGESTSGSTTEKQPRGEQKTSSDASKGMSDNLEIPTTKESSKHKRTRRESTPKSKTAFIKNEPVVEICAPKECTEDQAAVSNITIALPNQLQVAPQADNHPDTKPSALKIGAQQPCGAEKLPMPGVQVDKGKKPLISDLPRFHILKKELEKMPASRHYIGGPAAKLLLQSGLRQPDADLQPLGQRCQLCSIDLAFMPQGQSLDYNGNHPDCTVLPCGHAYHSSCYEMVHSSHKYSKSSPPCSSCSI